MSKNVDDIIEALLNVSDKEDWEFVLDYSSTGTTGDTCVGIETRDKYDDVNVVIDAINEEINGSVSSIIGDYGVNRIGHGWIVFFPSIKGSDVNEKFLSRVRFW